MGINAKQKPLWRQKDGTLISIVDMESSHIHNAIKMLRRGPIASHYKIFQLQLELDRRKTTLIKELLSE